MKRTFIGASFDQDEFREFAVRAAQQGKSKSGLLREIALKAIGKAPAQPAAHPAVKRAKAAAARPAPKRLKGHRRAA